MIQLIWPEIMPFLPGIIILGIATSIQDLRHGKISNWWIGFGIAYSLAINALSGNLGLQFAVNALASLAIGALMWMADLWKAGDAKLFLAFAMLVPLSTYRIGTIEHVPAAIILVNTFVPMFFFFTVRNILASRSIERTKALKDAFSKIPLALLGLFCITWGFSAIGPALPEGWFILAAILYLIAARWFKISHAIVISALRLSLDYSIYRIGFLFGLAGSAILVFAFMFLSRLSEDERMPFAFFLFLGMILTFVFSGSFAHALIGLMSR